MRARTVSLPLNDHVTQESGSLQGTISMVPGHHSTETTTVSNIYPLMFILVALYRHHFNLWQLQPCIVEGTHYNMRINLVLLLYATTKHACSSCSIAEAAAASGFDMLP